MSRATVVRRRLLPALLIAAFLPLAAWAADPLRYTPTLAPFGPGDGAAPGVLQVDDGTAEGTFGVGVGAARQFLWFNRFSLPPGLAQVEEIQVLFPSGDNLAVGAAIELAVYVDADGDPSNGATLLSNLPEIVQSLDGTFSVYPIDPPIIVPGDSDLLVGVINRFTNSGNDGPTSPAALDTTVSQERSWFALWSGDPPAQPTLPPDGSIDRIDDVVAGNWMIRARVSQPSAVQVPALGNLGLLLLGGLLAWFGWGLLRR
ncbi:MAG: IPTL-CTERM sorting domain-containing protein [Acidobacteriota bacterium]